MALFLQTAGKTVHFCIHPATGKIPGHMNAILAEYDVPYYIMKELNEIQF